MFQVVQVRIAPKHRSTHISNYQSNECKSNKHDEIPVCPRECFAYYKRPFRPILCCLLCFTFVKIATCCSLQITLLSNYLLPIILVLVENTLLNTACHFLLLLVGFDTLTYRKDYDISPILVGHHAAIGALACMTRWRPRPRGAPSPHGPPTP